ncbi:hypothetical protein [Labilibaculum manganireducens]|uniref:hypothetical protein n=1 Tax=Labilibaculum manganireducens TaxID=1940525 RepID=UPI00117AB167|nr:hypothetical protein [Labilibaculum manganireducens]
MAGTSPWRGRLNDIHRIPINNFQIVRKLLSSSNNYFIEFENQEHLKTNGHDMSCPYGFREPIICVDLCCIVHGRDITMACPF